MRVSKDNTETIIKNMRAEGHQSRADYVESMQQRELELKAQIDSLSRALKGILEWAEPIAGDNADTVAAELETRSVEQANRVINSESQQSLAGKR